MAKHMQKVLAVGGVDAKLNDGVLAVRVPKAERAQRRRIEVKSA